MGAARNATSSRLAERKIRFVPTELAGPRVRIAGEGDQLDAATWSGIPAGLATALRELGLCVDALDVTPRWHRRQAGRALASSVHAPRALLRAGVRETRPVAGRLANSAAAAARQRSASYRSGMARLPAAAGVVRMRGQFTVDPSPPSVVLDDLTLAQAFRSNWYGLAAASGRGREDALRLQRRAYSQAVACCTASRWAAGSVRADFGVPPERIHVVGFGVRGVPEIVERDWSQPRFLFIGLEWTRKNGDAVVAAFRRLRHDLPSAALDLVGDHPRLDEPGVALHGLLPRDRPDAQQHLQALKRRATCLVMPSRLEPFGLVYVEAGALGVPSIGTTVGGAADAVGEGGLLVDPDRPDELLAAMRRLADPAAARAYGAAARRHASRCTWQAVAQRMVRHLLPGRFDDVADLAELADR